MPELLLLILYGIPAVGLFLYGMNAYVLVALYARGRRAYARQPKVGREDFEALRAEGALPIVTTQVPLYNEANVAERVILAVAAMRYPKELHEIQVLDDSTDECCQIVDRVVGELRGAGYRIAVLRRTDRVGYKAGALKEGMRQAAGNYIAIFDGDFVPPADYLERLVPVALADAKIGFVQARWGHLNAEHSLLTRAQRIGIDGHFIIEQNARAFNALFMNFNGTAGLWRRQAIEEAGNWESDTLTEDLDLSYRSQLAGWKPAYVPDLVVPAELPQSYTAFKAQQFRWAKGSIQTARKLLPRVLRSSAPLFAKLQAVVHMTHYSIHFLMTALALLALPILTLDLDFAPALIAMAMTGIGIATFGPSLMYVVSQRAERRSWLSIFLHLPVLMCVGVGIALSNARAVSEALLGVRSGFVRTPKTGDKRKHYRARAGWLPWAELCLGAYCIGSLIAYHWEGRLLEGPFLVLYAAGFLLVGGQSLLEHHAK